MSEHIVIRYEVVKNTHNQYSVFPSASALPKGWIPCGFRGSKADCLAYIERHWTDITPRFAEVARLERDALLPGWLEFTAARHPEVCALSFEGTETTYAELDAWANGIAASLREYLVGPESVVGVFMERSSELIATILAVIKLGAAYLPLVPDQPLARVIDCLNESQPALLVTQPALIGQLEPAASSMRLPVIVIEDAPTHPLQLDDGYSRDWANTKPVRASLHGKNAINVIFTSGSTGKPKGVINCYDSLSNRIDWMQAQYALTADDVVLLKTPMSFDVAGWEIFWPLLVGARMVIARPGGHRDPDYLAELIETQRVSVLHFVPSMLSAFLGTPGTATRCGSLRMVFASGEALSRSLVNQFHATLDCRLYNLYGPTEAAIDVTHWTTQAAWQGAMPIGKAITGCQTLVLNEALNPVEPGNEGELYLAGICLARGYINSAKLTAEKFLPNPFAESVNERMYRTGDIVHENAQGELIYNGRVDSQVKIRGMRVELSEIENQLCTCVDVKHAAVIAYHPEATESPRLVAFFVPSAAASVHEDRLRKQLERSLPSAMHPHHYIPCTSLPINANGKLDRRVLDEKARSFLQSPENSSASTTPELQQPKERLRQAWFETLGHWPSSDDDNFFESGGDSIQVLTLSAKARLGGLNLRSLDIYATKTFSAILQRATGRGRMADQQFSASSPGTAPSRKQGLIPLTPIQHWFFEHASHGLDHWNQSFLLSTRTSLDAGLLRKSFALIASRHDVFSRRFERRDGHWHSLRSESPIAFSVDYIQRDGSSDAWTLQRQESYNRLQSSLDIREGRLAALGIFHDPSADHHRLLIVIHHLIVDGISWRTLLYELEVTYRALSNASTPKLLPPSHSYAAWANTLAHSTIAEVAEQQRLYWQSVCQRICTERLPRCRPGTEPPSNTGHELVIYKSTQTPLETEVVLNQLPKYYRCTINEILLAALATALQGESGQDHWRIMLEGHGRETLDDSLDVSGTVGWFTSLFPILLPTANTNTLHDTLSHTRRLVRSIPNKGFLYSALRYLMPSRNSNSLCVTPDITFNYLGQFDSIFDADSLFSPVLEDRGLERAPSAERFENLYIESTVLGRTLHVEWHYGSKLMSACTVQGVAAQFHQALTTMVRQYEDASRNQTAAWSGLVSLDTAAVLSATYPEVRSVAPLLPLQQGMFFHSLFCEDPDSYAVEVHVDVAGDLDPRRLLQAWRVLENTYDILAAQAIIDHDNPLLVFPGGHESSFHIVDLVEPQPNPPDTPMAEEGHRATITLSCIAANRWRLVWLHNHMTLDGTSVALLLRALFRGYAKPSDAAQHPLVGPASFSSFARQTVWETALRQEQADRAYWTRWLDELASRGGYTGTPKQASRPPEDAATTTPRATYAMRSAVLGKHSFQSRLSTAAKHYGVTPFCLFYVVWATLLSSKESENELVFLTTHSLRSPERPEYQATAGLLLNTLPLKTRHFHEKDTVTRCRDMMEALAQAREHANYPLFEIFSGATQALKDFTERCALLNIENYPKLQGECFGNLRIEHFESIELPHHPMTLNILLDEQASNVTLQLLFECSMYTVKDAETLLERYHEEMEQILSDSKSTHQPD